VPGLVNADLACHGPGDREWGLRPHALTTCPRASPSRATSHARLLRRSVVEPAGGGPIRDRRDERMASAALPRSARHCSVVARERGPGERGLRRRPVARSVQVRRPLRQHQRHRRLPAYCVAPPTVRAIQQPMPRQTAHPPRPRGWRPCNSTRRRLRRRCWPGAVRPL